MKVQKKNLLCVANAMKYLKLIRNIYNTIMKNTNQKKKSRHKNRASHGLKITDMTAKVDPNTVKITDYRAGVKISFAIEY
jgi:hypothetical protein